MTAAPLLVLVSVPHKPVADILAHTIVEARLAACVNILPQMHSVYRWEGKIDINDELLLLIKTSDAKLPALTDHILANHPYNTPSIVSLPITGGYPAYLDWVLAMGGA